MLFTNFLNFNTSNFSYAFLNFKSRFRYRSIVPYNATIFFSFYNETINKTPIKLYLTLIKNIIQRYVQSLNKFQNYLHYIYGIESFHACKKQIYYKRLTLSILIINKKKKLTLRQVDLLKISSSFFFSGKVNKSSRSFFSFSKNEGRYKRINVIEETG